MVGAGKQDDGEGRVRVVDRVRAGAGTVGGIRERGLESVGELGAGVEEGGEVGKFGGQGGGRPKPEVGRVWAVELRRRGNRK